MPRGCVALIIEASEATMNAEEREMIRHAREKYKAGEIDKCQLHDVYRLVADAMTEREMKCVNIIQL